MLAKKDKYEKGHRKDEKNQKKDKEEIKVSKAFENLKLKESKEGNIMGIRNNRRMQQERVEYSGKKSSKKMLISDEGQTQEANHERNPPSKRDASSPPNRAIKKSSKKMQAEYSHVVKQQFGETLQGKRSAELKEEYVNPSWHPNYQGLKIEQSKKSIQQSNIQTIDTFDFIQIDGIRINQHDEMTFLVLLENRQTKQQAHFNMNKKQLHPYCTLKKKNLVYLYFIKIMTAWSMHREI